MRNVTKRSFFLQQLSSSNPTRYSNSIVNSPVWLQSAYSAQCTSLHHLSKIRVSKTSPSSFYISSPSYSSSASSSSSYSKMGLLVWYLGKLESRPLLTKSATASFMFAAADLTSQLVNQGVDSSLVEKLKYEIEEFYKLPMEEKMKHKMRPGDVERNTLESYFSELQKLSKTILGLMAKALQIDEEEVEEMFEDGMQSVRMTYYPPCPKPELVVGFTPHSDASGITILLQVNGVEGLQVRKDGFWIPTNFLPCAFMVNVGDFLEIFSNGVYRNIEHRVTVNPLEERISIAMFFNPKFQAKVGPTARTINPENPPLFKRVEMEKCVKDFYSHKLNGKSFLERMQIEIDGDHELAQQIKWCNILRFEVKFYKIVSCLMLL
ncbi:codeine O-demethylase-like [Cornus florida]|uniref:codeine O-demethylase-like n=1 Tax=Cornus florida TaxID=4283 RepID=UPI00289B6071|nr:codeine O-demethylase-like [Cornus florida]